MNKKLLIGIVVIVVLGTLLFGFRQKLHLGSLISQNSQIPVPDNNQQSDASSSSATTPTPSSVPNPPYTGRDPQEVKPNLVDVEVFSEAQRQQVYGEIRKHGGEVKANPDFFEGWIDLGILKKEIGDYQGAHDAWYYAGVIRPANEISFANLGELYTSYIRDFGKAEANFRIAMRNKPNDPALYTSLADLYVSESGKESLAPDVLLEGLQANPGESNLMRKLASVYEQIKDYKNAILWWEKIQKLNPGDSQVKIKIEDLKKKSGG